MRIANLNGRLKLHVSGGLLDVEEASGGKFGSDPQSAYENWDELRTWAASLVDPVGLAYDEADLGAPVPMPRQIFAIALNYTAHAAEAKREVPPLPGVFTKFPTCLVGPNATVHLPTETVDWEVELVVVMGKRAQHVPVAEAWGYVAGLTIGQDLSERFLQRTPSFPQFALAKSMPGFGPLGPSVVTPDEFDNPDDLRVECRVNGESRQDARTSDMIFDVSNLISEISRICPMLPGDLIFTGTPSGIGGARKPPIYLQDGDVLETSVEGIGTMRNLLTTQVSLATPASV